MNKTTKIILLSVIITAAIIGNLAYYYQQKSSLDGGAQPTTYLSADGQVIPISTSEVSSTSTFNPWLAGGSVIIIALAIVAIIIIAKKGDSDKSKRDQMRKNNLETIAHGLDQYYIAYQHYPVSDSFDASYYNFLNFTRDWEYFKLPSAEIMQQYIEGWPILDPSISTTESGQVNHYLYYPHDNGQSYSLYAHFDTVKSDSSNNFNLLDKIPETLGQYNYKLDGTSHTQAMPNASTRQPINNPDQLTQTRTNPIQTSDPAPPTATSPMPATSPLNAQPHSQQPNIVEIATSQPLEVPANAVLPPIISSISENGSNLNQSENDQEAV